MALDGELSLLKHLNNNDTVQHTFQKYLPNEQCILSSNFLIGFNCAEATVLFSSTLQFLLTFIKQFLYRSAYELVLKKE